MVTVIIAILTALTIIVLTSLGFARWYMLTYDPPPPPPVLSERERLQRQLAEFERNFQYSLETGGTLHGPTSWHNAIKELRHRIDELDKVENQGRTGSKDPQ